MAGRGGSPQAVGSEAWHDLAPHDSRLHMPPPTWEFPKMGGPYMRDLVICIPGDFDVYSPTWMIRRLGR